MAHPFDPHRSWWTEKTLEQILPYIDALEVFNARSRRDEFNHEAYAFALEHGKLLMAGSDAHAVSELGRANMSMPWFDDAESLRAAAREATISGELSGLYVHMVSTFARVAKIFKA